MDLTTLNDEELIQMRLDVAAEQERRARLVEIPQQVTMLAQQFVESGGDKAALTEALTAEPEPTPEPEPIAEEG